MSDDESNVTSISPRTDVVSVEEMEEMEKQLRRLREPFPEERIEKLPKPKWRGAWDNGRASHCDECHGYHVLENCIHLDYVGHANVTDRLLEVDPFWEWEPMAHTPEGLPLFTKDGLWIKLTVCGVTRIGFGDGASVKEVIGDAIRNAAMRFGVGLDLWAKVDLQYERNPGDGKASQARTSQPRGNGRQDRPVSSERPDSNAPNPAPAPTRAPNQDALDALGDVCDKNGIPRRGIKQMFLNWAAKNGHPEGDILRAPAENIQEFTVHILESLDGGTGSVAPTDSSGDAGDAASNPPADPSDPEDTSDVEPKPGDLF